MQHQTTTSRPCPLPESDKGHHRGSTYIQAGRNRIKDGNDAYGLSFQEMRELINQALVTSDCRGLFNAISDAFYMGIEAGARLTEKAHKARPEKAPAAVNLSITEREIIEQYRKSPADKQIGIQQILGIKHTTGKIVKGVCYRRITGSGTEKGV